MSTVDYTRYTRIIHCRPCYNVYIVLLAIGVGVVVSVDGYSCRLAIGIGRQKITTVNGTGASVDC